MSEFFRTAMGRTFYEATMPMIARCLERIARALEAELKSRMIAEEDKPVWERNDVQFPRLLAEIYKMGLKEYQLNVLSQNMNLHKDEVMYLFDRAERAWGELKEKVG